MSPGPHLVVQVEWSLWAVPLSVAMSVGRPKLSRFELDPSTAPCQGKHDTPQSKKNNAQYDQEGAPSGGYEKNYAQHDQEERNGDADCCHCAHVRAARGSAVALHYFRLNVRTTPMMMKTKPRRPTA